MTSILTTRITEPHDVAQSRITQANSVLRQREEKPNTIAAAREFFVPERRLRARWNYWQSRFERPPANRKLGDTQELAFCQYLDRLDGVGMSAEHFMVTECATAILFCSYEQQCATTSQWKLKTTIPWPPSAILYTEAKITGGCLVGFSGTRPGYH